MEMWTLSFVPELGRNVARTKDPGCSQCRTFTDRQSQTWLCKLLPELHFLNWRNSHEQFCSGYLQFSFLSVTPKN